MLTNRYRSKRSRSSEARPAGRKRDSSYDEIVAGLEEVDLTKEQIEDFYTYLIDPSVELVEASSTSPPAAATLAEDEKSAPKLDLTVEPLLDSARLYLREIGKVPLPARPGDSAAKRIERGDMAAGRR